MAENHGHMYDDIVRQTVYDNFYADDCLKSLKDVDDAKHFVVQLHSLLLKADLS